MSEAIELKSGSEVVGPDGRIYRLVGPSRINVGAWECEVIGYVAGSPSDTPDERRLVRIGRRTDVNLQYMQPR